MYIAVPIQQGTHIIEYITFGVLLCVTHSDHLAIPTYANLIVNVIWYKLHFSYNVMPIAKAIAYSNI